MAQQPRSSSYTGVVMVVAVVGYGVALPSSAAATTSSAVTLNVAMAEIFIAAVKAVGVVGPGLDLSSE